MESKQKVALFGGSFNPIHNGHIAIAREIIQKKKADEVWFVPCGNHPSNKKLASAIHRINMIRGAIAEESQLHILTIETKKKERSYTANTLKSVKNEHQKKEFLLVIGGDNFQKVSSWKDFEYLRKEVQFIVVDREGYNVPQNFDGVVFDRLKMNVKISSNEIKERINSGKSITGLVPKSVENYLQKERLYCNNREKTKPWHVYILECRDGSLYTGVTNNLEKRMKAHKEGTGSKYVKRKGFRQLIISKECGSKSAACKEEYKIKQLPTKEKLDYLLQTKNIT